MAKIGLPKGSGKRLKVSEKSGNFEMDIEWQPCLVPSFLIGSSSFVQVTSNHKHLDWFKIGPDQTCNCGVSCP